MKLLRFDHSIILPPALVKKATKLAATRLRMTPEKLALVIVRQINPNEILQAGEEALLRGIDRKTLRGLKNAAALPEKLQ